MAARLGAEESAAAALQRMESLRIAGAMEAQELVNKGDELYRAGRYYEASEAYDGARELVPQVGQAAGWRAAVVERWAQACVEHARALAKKGEYAKARETLQGVLATDGLDGYRPARELSAQIDDPVRYNPALTPEHREAVVEVGRQLRLASGAFALGNFDGAQKGYEEVLRIDPHNMAARRGMEAVAAEKSKYYAASYDATRAELLAELDGLWALQPQSAVRFSAVAAAASGPAVAEELVSVKLDTLIIPRIDLQDASLAEAIDFLRAVANSAGGIEAGRKVDFVVALQGASAAAAEQIAASRVNLSVNNLPLRQALKYICEQTHTQFAVDEYAVRITPLGMASDRLITRTFRVAPDFISRQSASLGSNAAAPADPFAAPAAEGILPRRLSAQEVLESLGVKFGPGSAATFSGANSSIVVTNTPDMIALIEQIVASDAQTEPVQIVFHVTMIRARQNDLTELGYDWLLKEISAGKVIVGAAAANPLDVTAGNRSGDFAVTPDSIDAAIARDTFAQSVEKAPGVLSVDARHFATMLRGLNQKTGSDILAVPSVVTRPGQRARVSMVREFIFPTEYDPPELPNQVGGGFFNGNNQDPNQVVGGATRATPVTPAHPTSFDMREVGTILEVDATVSADRNYIDVQLAPVQTDFDGFINYGSPIRGGFTAGSDGLFSDGADNNSSIVTQNRILMPVFRTMRANTSVSIVDGGTLVFGGMQQQRVQDVEDKTPILGDLPLVGRFFQTKARESFKTAVIFMVRAELVDPTGQPFRQRN